jgi:hypothetical protein
VIGPTVSVFSFPLKGGETRKHRKHRFSETLGKQSGNTENARVNEIAFPSITGHTGSK